MALWLVYLWALWPWEVIHLSGISFLIYKICYLFIDDDDENPTGYYYLLAFWTLEIDVITLF